MERKCELDGTLTEPALVQMFHRASMWGSGSKPVSPEVKGLAVTPEAHHFLCVSLRSCPQSCGEQARSLHLRAQYGVTWETKAFCRAVILIVTPERPGPVVTGLRISGIGHSARVSQDNSKGTC